MCARPPVARAVSMTRSIARSSATSGRLARNPAYAAPCAHGVIEVAVLGVHQRRQTSRAVSAMAAASPAASRWANS